MGESGLVLKNFLPNKHQVLILNKRGECLVGRVWQLAVLYRLRPGYWIDYHLAASNQFYKITDVEIVATPQVFNYASLQFLHQALDLCVAAIPIGQIASELVTPLKMLTTINFSDWTVSHQRLFICYLISLLGFYPENRSQLDDELIAKIGQINILENSCLNNVTVDIQLDSFMMKWINNFVVVHSPRQLIKLLALARLD